jgi:2-methylisocitrate lyase-like PEP mutase family enzyme
MTSTYPERMKAIGVLMVFAALILKMTSIPTTPDTDIGFGSPSLVVSCNVSATESAGIEETCAPGLTGATKA